MRSIVRRDSGETYQEFLTRLAQASGIETPTRRPGAARSETPEERPQYRLAASARPRCAHHEDEGRAHASGPQGRARGRYGDRRDRGRTRCRRRSGRYDHHRGDGHGGGGRTRSGRRDGRHDRRDRRGRHRQGYYSNQVLVDLAALDLRTYIAEPDRGRRTDEEGRGSRRGLRESAADPRPARAGLAATTERAPGTPRRIYYETGGCAHICEVTRTS